MGQSANPPVFFVSYARADVEYEAFRTEMKTFVDELSARVATKLTRPIKDLAFFDSTTIEVGDVWPDELAEGLKTSHVGLALYTPNYFTRPWCGKEFQAFLNRRQAAQKASGIVPVLWTKCTTLPKAVEEYQYEDAAFPPEYVQVGMQRLLRLKAVYALQYDQAVEAVADRIVKSAADQSRRLSPMPSLDLDALPSAWDESVAANPESHKEGSVSKTCFVFVSRAGWDWEPYSAAEGRIGAVAQRISGELGLRYEEIKYDATLKTKLEETNKSRVPTVIFGDPSSLLDKTYAKPMQDYDNQYLLNCATLVPWDEPSRQAGENDNRWIHIRTNVCRQKTEAPPPFHEWRSIFSQDDLEQKTRTTIEQVRSRLMKNLMSEPLAGATIAVRKAEDAAASDKAAAIGIRTESPAQLESPTR
jgi:TIR domain-containing protein